jgi:energy-coupling factor transport system permease protein
VVHLASHAFELGGLLKFLRITVVAIVLLALGMMVSWTTNVADIAPAVARLGRPLKVFRVPVDDWAVALALSLRAFPMLLDEFRLLYAARRLRPRPVLTTRRARRRRWVIEMVDLMSAGVTVALRRADEMGDAITARGGTGMISAAPSGPKRADWVVLAISAALCAIAIGLQVTVLAGI